MKKVMNYGFYVIIVALVSLPWMYYLLLFPAGMIDYRTIIFDKYNSSGQIFLFYKSVSEVTIIFLMISLITGIFTLAGYYRKLHCFKRLFWINSSVVFGGWLWFVAMTIAEKNEAVFRFFIKIFSFVHGGVSYAGINLEAFQKYSVYFENRRIGLAVLMVLLMLSVIWAMTTKVEEQVAFNLIKVSGYVLFISMVHLTFDLFTKSHTLYTIFGINRSEWDYLSQMESIKSGFGLYFSIPVMLIIVAAFVIVANEKVSKIKLYLISFFLLLANSVFVIVGTLNRINNSAEYASQNNTPFYSVILRRVIISESIGLFVFEITTTLILIKIIDKKCSFLQGMVLVLCILICSGLTIMVSHRIDILGFVIGGFCLLIGAVLAVMTNGGNERKMLS